MRIYISSDMEGVAGVSGWEQIDARTPGADYEMFRRYYTQEVNAAIRGARAAGATDILVNDSHGPMRNLLLDELPDDVRVIFGNRKPFSMVHGADAAFDGALFIGYHGGIGDADAVLCHTYTPSVIYELTLNGTHCSEATINAALLGAWGVPLLMVSGDRTTVEGVRTQIPWAHGAIVKDSVGNFAADSLTPIAAQSEIERTAREAVADIGNARPFTVEPPIEMIVTLARVEQADYVELIPGFERSASRQVRFVDDSMETIMRAFVATFRLAAMA